MKPGWKTTEFWATVAVNVGTIASALAGVLPAKYAALVAAIATAAYSIGRGLAKATMSPVVPVVVNNPPSS
jgi:hypothetical protein